MISIDYETNTVSCKLPNGTKIDVIGNYHITVKLRNGRKIELTPPVKFISSGYGHITIFAGDREYTV